MPIGHSGRFPELRTDRQLPTRTDGRAAELPPTPGEDLPGRHEGALSRLRADRARLPTWNDGRAAGLSPPGSHGLSSRHRRFGGALPRASTAARAHPAASDHIAAPDTLIGVMSAAMSADSYTG